MVTARAAATFEPVGRSAGAARSFVRDALLGWGLPEVVDDAVVLVSELVTNAVVHAGTAAEVCCLREDGTVRIEVTDHHPERGLPSFADVPVTASDRYADPDGEGGRGLLMCSALAERWGVEYAAGRKTVWFRLALPAHVAGTRYAVPATPGGELPSSSGPVHVAVVQLDDDGRVLAWNADAEALFRHPADAVLGSPWADLAVWPQGPGLGLAATLRLARWEGGYGLRHADGRTVDVYGLQVRIRDTDGTPSTLCLLVLDSDRAVLRSPARALPGDRSDQAAGRLDLLAGPTASDDLDTLLQRTVERARDLLDADAAYVLLTTEDETEFEVRAATGLTTGHRRHSRFPVETGNRYDSARLPSVHEDLATRPNGPALLTGSGLRSLLTVPLKVEGRLIGSLGIAAAAPGRYDNEDALRLQFAADRVALAIESTRLTELDRLRRGSLSFLVEASDLLAGTLEHEQTLALMAQMAVPTLASWCAVYTNGDHGAPASLAFVLHEDEDRIDPLRALLDKTPAPESGPTHGVRFWTAPVDTARAGGLTDSPELSGLLGETVVLPLTARNRVIGLLVLGAPAGVRFRQEILELAEDLSRRAALALDNSRLYSERTATSQALQRSLLPPDLPEIPGVEVDVYYQAAGEGNEVGGDFYDLFTIREGTYGFAIGDVCGTGPEAASVTGLARHSLRLLAREGLDAPQVLSRLNAAILDEGSRSRFLTLLYGELTPRPDGSTELSLVCAGHPLPLRLRTDGQVDRAATPQPLLGVMDELDLTAEHLVLAPGEVLLCVTDGVTERREGLRMLGDDGLAEVLTGCTGLTAGAVALRVQRAVERFAPEPPSDDMAILTLRVPAQRVG
ncbi:MULTISPECIES: SpoIIE family protein phosphatase [unclassified Kitasatospora]|uniref:SpoIIE family protein phosphatase n=1 Tax=unclassified Kitasatospora TaxID=2633591 RepID=UPI001ADFE9F7|nr:SpoIIE family protein phosphatase [Kitasatospora sp. RG8]MBP0453657.1 SpoIIE family protein phosphatase [Kitasatospora sp. RG8]